MAQQYCLQHIFRLLLSEAESVDKWSNDKQPIKNLIGFIQIIELNRDKIIEAKLIYLYIRAYGVKVGSIELRKPTFDAETVKLIRELFVPIRSDLDKIIIYTAKQIFDLISYDCYYEPYPESVMLAKLTNYRDLMNN